MDQDPLDWLADRALGTLARREMVSPAALTLLLRRYAATGRADLGDALGAALGEAVAAPPPAPGDAAGWLRLFVESAAWSADPRLQQAAAELDQALRREWPFSGGVRDALASVDACLHATSLGGDPAQVQEAVDELERIVGLVYRPGEGVRGRVGGNPVAAGTLCDHATAARALLTAFSLTGRLPYSMLAEELMQFARRSWWDEARGSFGAADADFAGNCEAAEVCCRLAVLHDDAEYLRAAVVAEGCDYADAARRTLDALSHVYQEQGAAADAYGLALAEYVSRSV